MSSNALVDAVMRTQMRRIDSTNDIRVVSARCRSDQGPNSPINTQQLFLSDISSFVSSSIGVIDVTPSATEVSIMDITLRSSSADTELGFDIIGTYLAATTAVIGFLALAGTILRQRRRAVATDTYELDATTA
jgi:hypothetical protein